MAAPKAAPSPSTPTPMPPHTMTKRSPKKTNGPLSTRRHSFKSPAKRKKKPSPQERKADTEYDEFDTDYDNDLDEESPQKSRRSLSITNQSPTKIVGIDLGMWGYGKRLLIAASL